MFPAGTSNTDDSWPASLVRVFRPRSCRWPVAAKAMQNQFAPHMGWCGIDASHAPQKARISSGRPKETRMNFSNPG